jgi:hypothetical protein
MSNDIIVASSSPQAVDVLLKDLRDDFTVKNLGDLHYFLSIEVNRIRDGLLLTQEECASEVLEKANMKNCKPMSTPLSSTDRLSIEGGFPLGRFSI